MEREDTTPWYRQFWPWFIMALPASAVVAGLYTVWLAMQTGDSLVVHSSDGMNIVTERNLDAEREALRLGLTAMIDIQVETGAVAVAIRSELETKLPAALQLRLRHATMASRDVDVPIFQAMPNAAGDPVWVGHFNTTPAGLYQLILSSGDTWRLSAEWSGQTQIQLKHDGN